jgi:hypothetical protein
MPVITRLDFGTGIDTRGWKAGIDEGRKSIDALYRDLEKRVSAVNLKPPEIKSQSPGSGGSGDASGAQELAASILPIASKIQQAFSQSLAPLNAFAARFGAQFDAVGSTIIASARRIDEHLKFPAFQKAIDSTRAYVAAKFAEMEGPPKRWASVVDKTLGGLQAFIKVKGILGSIGDLARKSAGDFGKIKAPKLNFDFSTRSVNVFKGSVESAKSAMRGFGGEVFLALGLFGAGYKAVGFFKDAIKGASDLNETLSKTDAILGNASPAVKKFADDMASQFGLVKRETLDAASGFAGLGKGLGGLAGADLSKFSTEFTKLSADLSSFSNIDFAEASRAIKIGLSGEVSDTLKQLGVIVNETTVKQYALAHGIGKVGQALTEQQKVTARAGVIMEGLKDASGDLERTQDGAANQLRKLQGNAMNAAATFGAALLPAFTKGVSLLNELTGWVAKAFGDNQGTIAAWGQKVSEVFEVIGAVFRNWQAAFEVAKLVIVQGLNNILDYFEVIGPNAALVASYIAKNWTSLLLDAFNAIVTGLGNLWTNFEKIGTAIGEFLANPTKGISIDFTPILAGFEATAEKFPELIKPHLTDLSDEIAKAANPILTDLEKRKKALMPGGHPPMPGGPGGAGAKGKSPVSEELSKFAESFKQGLQTPLEKFREDTGKINEALAAGLINPQQQALGLSKAFADLNKDSDKGSNLTAGAVEVGSKEAFSAILKATAGTSNPQQRLEQAAREQAQLQREANRTSADILGAIKARPELFRDI